MVPAGKLTHQKLKVALDTRLGSYKASPAPRGTPTLNCGMPSPSGISSQSDFMRRPCPCGAFMFGDMPRENTMPETVGATATKLFLAHEAALEHAAARIDRLLTQDAGLTPAECFVVCLRAAAKFLAQYDKNEWGDMTKHASKLLLQHAMLASRVSGNSAHAKQTRPARGSRWPWRRG